MDIKVYALSTCPYCDKTIEFLKSNGIRFEIVLMDRLNGKEQEDAIAEAYRLSGQRSYPVTSINGTGVIGFDTPRFKKLLGLEAKGVGLPAPVFPRPLIEAENTAVEKLRFSAGQTGYLLNPDEELVKSLASGLLKNQARYGYRSCPCRLSTGDYNKDCDIICPCAYRDWDMDSYGRCYCGLYVTEDFIKKGAVMTPIPESRKGTPLSTPSVSAKEIKKEVDACEILSVPLRSDIQEVIKVFAYGLLKDSRDVVKEEFERIAKSLWIQKILWHGESAEGSREIEGGGKLNFRLLQGMDGYIYSIKISADRDVKIGREAVQLCSDSLRGKPNELYQLDIFIGSGSEKLLTGNVKGQVIRGGAVIFSGFESRENIRKYALTQVNGLDTDKIVDDIVRLETCYNLLLSQRQKYLLMADQLGRLEERVAAKMGAINLNLLEADGATLKEWLHFLSVNFGEVSGITEELKKHASDTEARRNVLNSILEKWEGAPVEGVPTISEPLKLYTRAIGDDYGRLMSRVEGIRREMGDVITIVRTRVDLIQQEQSLSIQKSMHETAKTQLKMQRAVESLEVFIVTYYMTSLAKITFEALAAQGRHLPDKPTILAGYLIPVFFVFAIFLSGKMGHYIHLLRTRKGEKNHD